MKESSKKQQILQDLKKFILSKTSIVYIQSDEEDRVEGLLKELSATFQPKPKLFIWNPFQGLTGENEKIENSKNPFEALDKVIQSPEQAFYLFEGLHPFLNTDFSLPRKLKDLHRAFEIDTRPFLSWLLFWSSQKNLSETWRSMNFPCRMQWKWSEP